VARWVSRLLSGAESLAQLPGVVGSRRQEGRNAEDAALVRYITARVSQPSGITR